MLSMLVNINEKYMIIKKIKMLFNK